MRLIRPTTKRLFKSTKQSNKHQEEGGQRSRCYPITCAVCGRAIMAACVQDCIRAVDAGTAGATKWWRSAAYAQHELRNCKSEATWHTCPVHPRVWPAPRQVAQKEHAPWPRLPVHGIAKRTSRQTNRSRHARQRQKLRCTTSRRTP